MIPYTTDRLRLREVHPADAPFILALLNSPGWLKHIGDRQVRDLKAAAAYVENTLQKSYRDHGYGLYLVERQNDGQSLGICGLVKRAHLEFPDLGFAILPEYESRGYTTEAARATLHLARHHWAIPVVLGITTEVNQRSQDLLLRLGLRRLALVQLGREPAEPLLLFGGS